VFDREKKNTRKVNGNMVDLAEVERAILNLVGIQEAQVTYEEGCVHATIRCSEKMGTLPDIAAIKKEMSRNLAIYKIPRNITII
jgi:acyl-CoA synthetase (AMP-forming)/AMP-acid ligase II